MTKSFVSEYKRRSGQKWTRKPNKTAVTPASPVTIPLKTKSATVARKQHLLAHSKNRLYDLTTAEIKLLKKCRNAEGETFQLDGYKFTDSDAYSLGRRQRFEVGRRYVMTTPVQMCKVGWHFSPNPLLAACFFQAPQFRNSRKTAQNPTPRRLFEVRARGKNMVFGSAKFVTGDIEFLREITGDEYTTMTTGVCMRRKAGRLPSVFDNGDWLFCDA